MIKRPLTALALSFSLGIFVAGNTVLPPFLLYLLLTVSLILTLLSLNRPKVFDIFMTCLVFSLGGIWLNNFQAPARNHISKFISYKTEEPYIVTGFIGTKPVIKKDRLFFVLKAQAVQSGNLNRACSGNILVYLKEKKDLLYGQALMLRGNLCRPFTKPGYRGPSYRDYLYNQGIWFMMNVKTNADIIQLKRNRGLALKRFALCLNKKMKGVIYKYLPDLPASILAAMILGEAGNIPSFIHSSMIKSGTIHILVVSGFNVGLVAFMVSLLLKLLRLPRKERFLITILALVVYCLLTGASTPVLRATAMAVFFMIGSLVKREPDIYNSLGIAWLFILAFNPRQLFDIGFQLSFASVIAIVYLYPKIKALLGIESIKIRFLRFIVEGCLVSFSAWLGTLGLIAYYFKIFSPITVLANIFIVPLAALITLCGFSLILISIICPPLAQFIASAAGLGIWILLRINNLLIKLPAAYFNLA